VARAIQQSQRAHRWRTARRSAQMVARADRGRRAHSPRPQVRIHPSPWTEGPEPIGACAEASPTAVHTIIASLDAGCRTGLRRQLPDAGEDVLGGQNVCLRFCRALHERQLKGLEVLLGKGGNVDRPHLSLNDRGATGTQLDP
jgi:hypothetical protein